ncbi:cation-translocating P-type ATPase [Candidatus Dojkabacteria bacterium]|nr:cation-translocating P-type ATPase [Candidatus Dojkabacteria bacterium]
MNGNISPAVQPVGTFHAMDSDEIVDLFKTSINGLDDYDAKDRLVKFGFNKLVQKKKVSPIKIFIEQFKGYLVYLLFGAAVLSFVVDEVVDGIAILVILLLNGILGFIQEYKAERAIESLKKLEAPHAKITRGGRELIIPSEELVIGDVVMVNEGDKISADIRLIEAFSLQIEEAILTGESQPVTKHTNKLKGELALPDRKNMGFSGTIVTKGRGKGIVIATGMNSEIGKIAHLVNESEQGETPLQITLEKLGKYLGTICVVIALPGLLFGILTGRDVVEMVMTAISLAVSAIPEGLPVVVTIALALGTRRMVKRGVLIRKLNAVEALGSTDIICSDKTGTITLNKMTVTQLYLAKDESIEVESDGLSANFSISDKNVDRAQLIKDINLKNLAQAITLCNDADMAFGDPTEQALLRLVEQMGSSTEEFKNEYHRLDEIPFDSANKYMVTLNQVADKKVAFIKGAPEIVIPFTELDQKAASNVLKVNETMSGQALRVLAVGMKVIDKDGNFGKLSGYKFLGLVGMIDPPRVEVAEAIKTCNGAGVRVIMITGDHPLTAGAVSKKIGLDFEKVVTGMDLDKMSEAELKVLVEKQNVFARVSPVHKLQILQALQNNKHMVAMTGDGVNDAPALKEANIGIAVGSGSDLAKEVSDMIILDDNFATIAKAINEGRGIFFNIKKFVKFLVSANFDEILVILMTIIFKIPLPFLPIHLLWLNLATDSLPALALSTDKYANDLMKKKPYNSSKEIFHGVFGFSIVAGLLAFVASMGVFLLMYFVFKVPLIVAQTMTFTTTVLFEFFIVFVCRTEKSIFSKELWANKFLIFAVVFGVGLQAFAVYFPYTNEVFKTVPLAIDQLGIAIAFGAIGLLVFEILRALKLNHFELSK